MIKTKSYDNYEYHLDGQLTTEEWERWEKGKAELKMSRRRWSKLNKEKVMKEKAKEEKVEKEKVAKEKMK